MASLHFIILKPTYFLSLLGKIIPLKSPQNTSAPRPTWGTRTCGARSFAQRNRGAHIGKVSAPDNISIGQLWITWGGYTIFPTFKGRGRSQMTPEEIKQILSNDAQAGRAQHNL